MSLSMVFIFKVAHYPKFDSLKFMLDNFLKSLS
jgi:hypothetical protein